MFRYRTEDLPPLGVGAFMPIPASTPVPSSYGLVHVAGAPGTEPIPSPRPPAVPSQTVAGGRNSAQGSDVAPDVILPSLYVASAANMGPTADAGIGMARRRFCELPLPAKDPTRIPITAFVPPSKLGGRATMAWPRAFQRFPLIGGGSNG